MHDVYDVQGGFNLLICLSRVVKFCVTYSSAWEKIRDHCKMTSFLILLLIGMCLSKISISVSFFKLMNTF